MNAIRNNSFRNNEIHFFDWNKSASFILPAYAGKQTSLSNWKMVKKGSTNFYLGIDIPDWKTSELSRIVSLQKQLDQCASKQPTVEYTPTEIFDTIYLLKTVWMPHIREHPEYVFFIVYIEKLGL